ncbi:MAG TPA: BamA/TamA family outer membrane protein [Candidatus Eisenbacteria bacterium]|nr:BamA/TamA family outer membrane protein [Candidatus Eisenbacteria bacterium]
MRRSIPLLTLLVALAATPVAQAREFPIQPVPDTLEFVPSPEDSSEALVETDRGVQDDDHWMRAPMGDDLLTDRDQWRSFGSRSNHVSLHFSYDRVDRMKPGVGYQLQVPQPMAPRVGARIAYATGRNRTLYGFQVEQPVIPPGRISIGGSLVRRTDHSELQQVSDAENTLALLFARQDYRDYWEREGMGLYLSWRVPDFSNVSVHLRRDEYRSVIDDPGVRSWFRRSRTLRANPAIDDREGRTLALRLERLAHTTRYTHAGFYHWIEMERSGGSLGGDFEYTRILGDLRSVVRLSPATTLMLRTVFGHTPSGTLPRQKEFPLGGVDGLRAHPFAAFRGDQVALMQAEYIIGLWRLRTGAFEGGLHAIVFADAGQAWFDANHDWSLGDQRVAIDGGVGLAVAEDKLRVYFAKNLQRSNSDFVVSARLQRPF